MTRQKSRRVYPQIQLFLANIRRSKRVALFRIHPRACPWSSAQAGKKTPSHKDTRAQKARLNIFGFIVKSSGAVGNL